MTLEAIEHSMESWPAKLIRATRGNQTLTGCIIIAVLGRAPKHAPRFVEPTAHIDGNGIVRSGFQQRWQDGTREFEKDFAVGSTIEVRDDLRGLADACKLSDLERSQFFAAVGKWIERDERAIASSLLE